MAYIVAIDVGVKNLGLCAYDMLTNKVVCWATTSLVPNGRYIPAQNVRYVREFVERYSTIFAYASAILIERQMRCNMRIIESLFQCLYFDRTLVISPKSVKVHYDLATNNYRHNKEKAVEWAKDFVDANPGVFDGDLAQQFLKAKKQDDMADALLLAMYYLDTFSVQLD